MENKSITKLAKLFLKIWNISLFLIVWLDYYNDFAFDIPSSHIDLCGFPTALISNSPVCG